jgi:hypothetical protein
MRIKKTILPLSMHSTRSRPSPAALGAAPPMSLPGRKSVPNVYPRLAVKPLRAGAPLLGRAWPRSRQSHAGAPLPARASPPPVPRQGAAARLHRWSSCAAARGRRCLSAPRCRCPAAPLVIVRGGAAACPRVPPPHRRPSPHAAGRAARPL